MIKVHKEKDGHFSIFVKVEDEEYIKSFEYEKLACKLVNRRKMLFRVESIPFLIYGINRGDIIKTDVNLHYSSFEKDGGEYGYRIAFRDHKNHMTHERNSKIRKQLESLGCTVEMDTDYITSVSARDSFKAVELEIFLNDLTARNIIIGFDTIR